MKKPNQFIVAFASLLAIGILFSSCSRDRVEAESMESMDEFFNENQEEEQEFVITSDSGDCIVAKKGTIICPDRTQLQTASGDTVGLPYSVYLIELYGNSDLVKNLKPSASSGVVFESGGSHRLNAAKDGANLSFKSGGFMGLQYNAASPSTNISSYSGTFEHSEVSDWAISSTSQFFYSDTVSKINLLAKEFSWLSPGGANGSSNSATVTFTTSATGTEHIRLFAVSESYVGVIAGSDLVISGVPTGQDFTLIAMALNADGDYLLHTESVNLTEDYSTELSFDVKKKEELQSYIDGL